MTIINILGKDWFAGFQERHGLSCRKPEATSMARSTAFNRTTVAEFFQKLSNIYDRYDTTKIKGTLLTINMINISVIVLFVSIED